MLRTKKEEYRVTGEEVLAKVKQIIKEGNARRIILQNDKGKTIVEIPVTIAVVSTVFAPMLAAVGALAGILTNCRIIVEKK